MVNDHSKANEELKAIAKEENVEWPGKKGSGQVEVGQGLHGCDGERS
jgi:hypothetical protein